MKEKILSLLNSERLSLVDKDFVDYELQFTSNEDLTNLLICVEKKIHFKVNERNSLLMYLLDITDQFDFIQGRSDTKGGAAPDIDMDFSNAGREKLIEYIVSVYGIDNVANIGTRGTFQAKSLTARYFSITAPENPAELPAHFALRDEITSKFPPPLFGKQPTLKEIVMGDPTKGYPAHTELIEDPRFFPWFEFVHALDGMNANASVHAAGMMITEFPVHTIVPTYTNKDYDRVTQFDMKECEALGLIKYDFLVIKMLDVLQYAVHLVKQRHDITIDIYDIPDHDPKAYSVFAKGLVAGIFQFETSDLIKDAAVKARPGSIDNLSDISALVRPGPMSAGFLTRYLENTTDPDIPSTISKRWADTRNVLVYQEQLIQLFTEVAGLSLQEADTARRAVGKKDKKYLEILLPAFRSGCLARGITAAEVDRLWEVIMGCSDYLFNKSHSVAYSYLSYVCAYLKGNYPVEYFCALLTIGSQMLAPKVWKTKVTEYLVEAREFGLNITHPDINSSGIGFTISQDSKTIHFGLNGIKNVGSVVATILQARKRAPFASMQDFFARINQTKVNTKVFEALIDSGCFDSLYPDRTCLKLKTPEFFAYKPNMLEYQDRLQEIEKRKALSAIEEPLIEARDELRRIQKLKKGRELTMEELRFIEEHKELKRRPELKPKLEPEPIMLPAIKPNARRTLQEILNEGKSIGCYLGKHPSRAIFPEALTISSCSNFEGKVMIAGSIINASVKTTKKGSKMVVFDIEDGTGSASAVMFSDGYNRFVKRYGTISIEPGMIVKLSGDLKVSNDEASDEDTNSIEIVVKDFTMYLEPK